MQSLPHGQNCTFRNYSKVPNSQGLGPIGQKYEFNKLIGQSFFDKEKPHKQRLLEKCGNKIEFEKIVRGVAAFWFA